MKLVIFSDIHGNNFSFNAFLSKVSKFYNSHNFVFLGDFLGYYYGANEIITYCRENNIQCVLGNHDKYFLDILDGKRSLDDCVKRYGRSYDIALKNISKENIEFLRSLEAKMILINGSKRILLCHGSPLNNLEGRIYPDTDLSIFSSAIMGFDYVITGHTHYKMSIKYASTLFLNPGSLGQQRDGKGCSYMILDLNEDTYSFHTVGYSITCLEDQIDIHDAGRYTFKEVLRRGL